MASVRLCGLSDEQVDELYTYYLFAGEDMSWVVRNLLEKLINCPILITERTLNITNSYNEVEGTVVDMDGHMVKLANCSGLDQYGVELDDRWYDVRKIYVYHPSMLAFFKLIDNVQDKV